MAQGNQTQGIGEMQNLGMNVICVSTEILKVMDNMKSSIEELTSEVRRLRNKDKSPLMTISEVCQALNISKPTYYRLRDKGILTPVKSGKKGVRVPREEVERHIGEDLSQYI